MAQQPQVEDEFDLSEDEKEKQDKIIEKWNP